MIKPTKNIEEILEKLGKSGFACRNEEELVMLHLNN